MLNDAGADRPILIIGFPRSGTRLIRNLLRAHSRITFPWESHLLPELWRLHGDPADAAAAARLAADLSETIAVGRWQLALSAADLAHHRTFRGMVDEMFRAWARAEGKPRYGEKTPSYTLELATMQRIMPDAQIVHIVRDPRAACASMVQHHWGPRSIRTAAAEWRAHVEAGRRDGRRFGPGGYHELRYEELAAEPDRVLRRVCEFLGERFEPQMLHPNPLPARDTGLEVRGDVRSHIDVPAPAESALGERDRAVVAWEAGDLMEELGYHHAGPRRPPRPGEMPLRRLADRAAVVRFRMAGPVRRRANRDLARLLRMRLRNRTPR